MSDEIFKKIISHAKEYGFVFQSSEIYDGLSAVYDYTQNGVLLKNNIKDYWWKSMVQLNDNIVGIDSSIFSHPTTWKASGHVDAFNDPMIDNKDSKKRYRADNLIEDYIQKIEAKINKEKFNLDNFYLINSNWLEPFKENSFDIVVSNPPYVAPSDPHLEELKHEPILALISEQNGLEDFDLISSQAIKVLKVDGLLAFEHGNNQSNDVKKIMTIYGFKNITLIHDYQSNPRITIGKK